ncbi:BtrH N-terminal domain-containing protein [Paenibacillus sp. S150]|uniref:BtrH N-terminal domain-containing protein n=1 Tax=Paenibacillus sp. S150 TaxID=2749826 RepID=UPI001C585119|nr:BtrH N-terminal domain-containing protein [Paenibacillus sp. S150]MBW4080393.1 hypothetical protein [Paenibacillus sp. S150]
MIDMDIRQDPLPGENCYIMALNNILDHQGFAKFLSVWKMCGLFYDRNTTNRIGALSPRDTSIQEELRIIHGIELSLHDSRDAIELMDKVIHLLDEDQPVIVFTDAYELPYHISYRRNHVKHCLTLLNYCDGEFQFLDDHHQVKGEIRLEVLQAAACLDHEKLHNRGGSYKARWLNCREASSQVGEKAFFDVLRHNVQLLSGQEGFLAYTGESHALSGLDAMDALLSDLERVRQTPAVIDDEVLSQIHHFITFVANSRYLYCEFLKEGIPYNNELHKLIEAYTESGQSWKVISNMALKTIYATNRSLLFDRMMNKFQEARAHELEALNIAKAML